MRYFSHLFQLSIFCAVVFGSQKVYAALAPEIAVEQPAGITITNGGARDFGSVAFGTNSALTFTLRNLGDADLMLNGNPKVTVTGPSAGDFTVTVQPVSPVGGSGDPVALTNAGFESPDAGQFAYTYAPTGSGWTFGTSAGLARNGSPWFVNSAPEGIQAAFIQSNNIGSSVSRSVSFPSTGNYVVRFSLVRRGFSGVLYEANDVAVRMDGVTLGTITNTSQPDDTWRVFSVPFNCTNAGNHTLSFAGMRGGGDYDSCLDNVQILGATSFQVTFTPSADGSRSAVLSIANNDSDENPFVINVKGATPMPDIALEQPVGASITNGGSNYLGSAAVGISRKVVFTLKNLGDANLALMGNPSVAVSGSNASEFTVTTQPLSGLPATGSAVLTNGGFESPSINANGWIYSATNTGWTFNTSSGVARNGSPWYVNPALEGVQAAYIQSNNIGSTISRSINFPKVGTYGIRFSLVRRSAAFPANDIEVRMDGLMLTTVSNISQPDDVWRTFNANFICTNAGDHSLTFVGTRGGADYASALDNVQIVPPETTFEITFIPAASGLRTATLSITNNDGDENPFVFQITGTGVPSVYTVDSLGDAGTGSGTVGDLRYCINQANASPPGILINLTTNGVIALQGPLPILTNTITISGSGAPGAVISGSNQFRVFFVDAPGCTVNLRSLNVADGYAKGGDGGPAAGGGLGAGGALFVNSGAVTGSNVNFSHNSARGGNGGNGGGSIGGGGGGLGGAGGGSGSASNGGGGGGYLGNGGTGGSSFYAGAGGGGGIIGNGGNGSGGTGGGGGGTTSAGTPPTPGAGGGSGGFITNTFDYAGIDGHSGSFGGGGGGAAGWISGANPPNGADGGAYGGGGGGSMDSFGHGGRGGGGGEFGGGGGAVGSSNNGSRAAGNGGFGGGGGGAGGLDRTSGNQGGGGGFGGGGGGGYINGGGGGAYAGRGGSYNGLNDQVSSGGGGGAALGGAIFVRSGNGASLEFIDATTTLSTVTAGLAGPTPNSPYATPTFPTDGQAWGEAMFLPSGDTLFYGGSISNSISGVTGAALRKVGSGTLTLFSQNSYDGGTLVDTGTLLVNSPTGGATGPGTVQIKSGAILAGIGSINGSTTNSGTLAPGNGGPGILTFDNNLTLNRSSTNVMELGGTNGGGVNGYDAINVSGTLTMGGRLKIVLLSAPITNSYKLFAFGTSAGKFDVLELPSLPSGLGWNTNALATNGRLDIVTNQPPTLSAISNVTCNEESSTQTVNLAGISAGPSESQLLTVTATTSNTNLIGNLTVNYTSPSATGILNFQPMPHTFGSATITVTVTDDASITGTSNSLSQTFTVTVKAINHLPSFTKGSDQMAPAFSVQTVSSWATDISDGDGAGQALFFHVTNNNPGLFATQPAVASNGTLTYTPKGLPGIATVSVSLTDDNSINSTPALTSGVQTFTISLTAPKIAVFTGSTTNAANERQTGVGTNIFTSTFVGQTSAVQTFTIQNTGNTNLTDLAVTLNGGNPSDFTISAPGVTTLAPNSTTTFTVVFAPTNTGVRTAIVNIASNDGNENPFVINVQGTGLESKIVLEQPAGLAATNGASRDFGTMYVGTNRTLAFVVRNDGEGLLVLSNNPLVVISGANAADFTVTQQPETSIAAKVELGDESFEALVLGGGQFVYGPGGSSWTFGDKAGLARNGSPWYFNLAPAGSQAAFIQLNSSGAYISQTIVFPATGTYPITFSLVRRGSSFEANDIEVRMDEMLLGSVSNAEQPDDTWRRFSFSFVCTNTGPHTLKFVGVRGGADNASAIDNVMIGNSSAFQITFTPSANGLRTASLSITNNDRNNNPYTLQLTGTGVIAPEIAVFTGLNTKVESERVNNVDTNTFAATRLGSTSASQTFTIQNTGNTNLSGLAVTLNGVNPGDFTISALGTTTLAPKATTTFTVAFAPAIAGVRTAVVNIASNDGDENPFAINVSGSGIAPNLTIDQPSGTTMTNDGSRDFGVVAVGADTNLTFTLRNIGYGSLSLSGDPLVQVTGPNAADFAVTTQPTTAVFGDFVSVSNSGFETNGSDWNFGATTGIATNGSQWFANNAPEGTRAAYIYGSGFSARISRQLFFSAVGNYLVSFSLVRRGGGYEGNDIQVRLGPGLGSLISHTNQTDDTWRRFALPFNCTSPGLYTLTFFGLRTEEYASAIDDVRIEGSGTFQVAFTPSGAGPRTATLSIASDDLDENLYTLTLTGTGILIPEINVFSGDSTSSVDALIHNAGTQTFAATSVGSNSFKQTFTIQNPGLGDLTNLNVTLAGANTNDFIIGALGASSISSGAATTFTVTFAPKMFGDRNAILKIGSNDADENPFSINLSGVGVGPQILIEQPLTSPVGNGESRTFGNVNVGTNATLSFFINNVGNAGLNLTGNPPVTVTGAQASEFMVTTQPGSSVTAGNAVVFTNAGFEAPIQNAGDFSYAPSGSGWQFGASAGIARNGSPWFVNGAPEGVQAAFLQKEVDASISRAINFSTTGIATISFAMVRRGSGFEANSVEVRMDGALLDTITHTRQPDDTWRYFNVTFNCTNAGDHTLSFVGTRGGDDNASVVDDVKIVTAGRTMFQVRFAPGNAGLRSATVAFANDSWYQNPFEIHISGFGLSSSLPEIDTEHLLILTNGAFQFTFTNAAQFPFSIYATTNLNSNTAEWIRLGNATNLIGDVYQFTDSSNTNVPTRFYQLRYP